MSYFNDFMDSSLAQLLTFFFVMFVLIYFTYLFKYKNKQEYMGITLWGVFIKELKGLFQHIIIDILVLCIFFYLLSLYFSTN
ncbi:hypothetical protein SAMN02745728_00205 [Desulfovibrio litoralis DSM 11393]|uniref:Uncharacterized protein n=1 Tax=Desulfovibrio litoralis DSM 11393 TaxID=1121455 RepID=A0A1M7RV04_9BACT|nr:hypothetical protein SAMN02745728_00205 [Desulfovibrio litoralis DSM 11393]